MQREQEKEVGGSLRRTRDQGCEEDRGGVYGDDSSSWGYGSGTSVARQDSQWRDKDSKPLIKPSTQYVSYLQVVQAQNVTEN